MTSAQAQANMQEAEAIAAYPLTMDHVARQAGQLRRTQVKFPSLTRNRCPIADPVLLPEL
jgi:hypothetical protein